jgi:hypothetical protein
VSAADLIRDKARTWELNAVSAEERRDEKSALGASIIAIVLHELAAVADELEDEARRAA